MILIILILFIFIHIWYQHSVCDDLEIHEISFPSKKSLEEICNFKQPVIFHYPYNLDISFNEYYPYDVSHYEGNLTKIPLSKSLKRMKNHDIISKDNHDFLEETRLFREYQKIDKPLVPYLCVSSVYDIIYGSIPTPLEFITCDRHYILCIKGSVLLRITTPINKRYIHTTTNIWDVKENKIKYKEITLDQGKMIYIPAYWWYTIKLNSDAVIVSFKYRTIMNMIATLHERIK